MPKSIMGRQGIIEARPHRSAKRFQIRGVFQVNRLLLAIALLTAPAFAAGDRLPQSNRAEHRHCKTDIVQSLNATLAFRTCPEMMNWFKAVEIARQERLSKPCAMKGRVRSKADGKCYLHGRMP